MSLKTDVLQTICANWRTLTKSIKRKTMTTTLPPHVQKHLMKRLAEDGKPLPGANIRVELFGPRQVEYKKACVAPGAKLGNEIRKHCLDGQVDNQHLLAEHQMKDDLPRWAEEAEQAEKAAKRWINEDYLDAKEAGIRACDHNFPYPIKDPKTGRTVPISHYLRYPTKKAMLEGIEIKLFPPRRMTVETVEDYAPCGAALAAKYAGDRAKDLEVQFEAAKVAALEFAAEALDKVEKQTVKTPDGQAAKKLFESVLDDARVAAQHLRNITAGYKADKRLEQLAATIEERITHLDTVEILRHSESEREKVHRAAVAVNKSIRKIVAPPKPKAVKKAPAKKAKAAKAAKGQAPVVGGLVGEMLSKAS